MNEETHNQNEVKNNKEKLSPEQIKEIEKKVKRAEKLADVLDDKYLDPIIGFVGGPAGDAATSLAGLYIIYEAKESGVSTWELSKMIGRTGLDFLKGGIPIFGDIFDAFYKSNKTNAEVLRKHFEEIKNGVDTTKEDEGLLIEKDRKKEKTIVKKGKEMEEVKKEREKLKKDIELEKAA